jgi:hypothetical protein
VVRCSLLVVSFDFELIVACPAPNYGSSLFGAGRFVRFSAKYLPFLWRLVLHQISNKVNKKNGQKGLFLVILSVSEGSPPQS